MAVAVDASGTNFLNITSLSATWNYNNLTVGSPSNGAIAVWVACDNLAISITSVKWGSQNLTQVATVTVDGSASGYNRLYAGLAPTSGNQTLTVSLNAAATGSVFAQSYSGVNQTSIAAAFTNANSNAGNNSLNTVSITSGTSGQDMVIASHSVNGSCTAVNQTQVFLDTTASGNDCGGNRATATGAAIAMTMTDVSTVHWGSCGVNIVASAAAATPPLWDSFYAAIKPARGPWPRQAFTPFSWTPADQQPVRPPFAEGWFSFFDLKTFVRPSPRQAFTPFSWTPDAFSQGTTPPQFPEGWQSFYDLKPSVKPATRGPWTPWSWTPADQQIVMQQFAEGWFSFFDLKPPVRPAPRQAWVPWSWTPDVFSQGTTPPQFMEGWTSFYDLKKSVPPATRGPWTPWSWTPADQQISQATLINFWDTFYSLARSPKQSPRQAFVPFSWTPDAFSQGTAPPQFPWGWYSFFDNLRTPAPRPRQPFMQWSWTPDAFSQGTAPPQFKEGWTSFYDLKRTPVPRPRGPFSVFSIDVVYKPNPASSQPYAIGYIIG